uniref:Uncharacterized protein n=1 Tax=Romanomermis culicivorax TaxID=13658 RepID=A0A915I6X7_ROMCU
MLDRELYRVTKKMERLEKQLEVVTRQRDDAVVKLTEFELFPKEEKEKIAVLRQIPDCPAETERPPSKISTGSDGMESTESNDENLPTPRGIKDQTFTLTRKSILDNIENTSAVNKSTQEMKDKCKQQ